MLWGFRKYIFYCEDALENVCQLSMSTATDAHLKYFCVNSKRQLYVSAAIHSVSIDKRYFNISVQRT